MKLFSFAIQSENKYYIFYFQKKLYETLNYLGTK